MKLPHLPRCRFFFPLLVALAAALFSGLPARAEPAQWRDEIARMTARPAEPMDVVFVGSSSIRMWLLLNSDFPSLRVINRGFGGSELEDSVFYFDQLVRPHAPRAVVLYAGENDLAAGVSPEKVLADFRAFRDRLHAALPAARLLYISCKPSPSRARFLDVFRRTNALIAAECATSPSCTYVDVFTSMLDDAGQPRLELFGSDHLHMNSTGYALWTKLLTPYLTQALAGTTAR